MATLVTRSGKGSPLTHAEVDANFTNLNTDKLELSGGTMTGNLSFGDNDKAIFGAGSDLQIYHDGSNSYVDDVGTGNLLIRAENLRLQDTSGNRYFHGRVGDATSIYHAGSLRISTTATGIDVNGDATFGDNDKAIFGAGSDLEIYHDGSHSYIRDAGTGDLKIQATNLKLQDVDGVNYVNCIDGGYVRLAYAGTTVLETTSTGIEVTGTVTADGLTVEGGTGNYGIELEARTDFTGISGQLAITDSTGSAIFTTVSGSLNISTGATFGTDTGTQRLQIGSGGDISFYEDTGTTAKFFWDASAESLRIGTYNGSGLPSGSLFVDSNANNHAIHIEETAGGSESWQIGVDTDGDLGFYNSQSTTASVTFDDAGNVGIGTSSPSADLHIVDDVVTLSLESDNSNAQKWNILSTYTNTGGSYGAFIIEDEAGSDWLRFDEGNGSPFSQFLVNGTERMRITSDGSVGIGTSSPSRVLHVSGGSTLAQFQSSTTGVYLELKNSGGNAAYIGSASGSNLVVETGGSERMRIDSSGNILAAGKAGLTDTGAGHAFAGGTNAGLVYHTRDDGLVMSLNRLTSDGNILRFVKDGTAVGSIGSSGGYTKITSGNGTFGSGLIFNNVAINPVNAAGSVADATVKLGDTTSRFTDLYLSGGVYLGGTGAANKLDDYEEGTWTATAVGGISGVSSSTANNRYTKIGNTVSVIGELYTFTGQTTNTLEIGGLPYAVGGGYESSCSVLYTGINLDSGYTQVVGYAKAGSAVLRLYEVGDNVTYSALRGNQMGSGSFIFQMTYHTT